MQKHREAVGGQAQPRTSWAEGPNMKNLSQGNAQGPWQDQHVPHPIMEEEKAWARGIRAGPTFSNVSISEKKGFDEKNTLAERFGFSQKVCVHILVAQPSFPSREKNPCF